MGSSDWVVVAVLCLVSMAVGVTYTRRAASQGANGYFTGNRNLPWWAIGLSNTATYQSGNGGFVMLVLVYGLAGNWLWWAAWVIWMPLVAIVWARMWRRMRIVTTAELITLRYGGTAAKVARKIYGLIMLAMAVLIMAYITGFFAKTVAPLIPISEAEILLIFGGITVIYTVLGGLMGVVFVDVAQFAVLFLGSFVFFLIAAHQHGGWWSILERVASLRPEGLQQVPPTAGISGLTVLILVVQGFFFAGSPTAGEGMTAQRFMAARNERHALGGQLFNAFLALSLRTVPLIGLGVIAMGLFWVKDLTKTVGPAPAGVTMLADPAFAWGELVKSCRLPAGFVGLLVTAEVAAFMSTLSSLINWGGSFAVNDFYKAFVRKSSRKAEILVSRLTTLFLFILAAAVSVLYVDEMVSWFLFINSAMVVFLLPLAWFRFFWWRFNVWGELAASVLGLPLSILVWFVFGFEDRPPWQGIGILFLASLATLVVVTLLTPPESKGILSRFYAACRPIGLWKPVQDAALMPRTEIPATGGILLDSLLGILACLGLVTATNAAFVGSWVVFAAALAMVFGCGFWLLRRCLVGRQALVGAAMDAAVTVSESAESE